MLLVSLLGLLSLALLADVYSTTAGGNWSNGSTWIGGVVPPEGANVVIQGTVYINSINRCNNLTLTANGRITNPANDVGQVTVYGNLANNGQIVDSGASGEARMVVQGNITNNLTITCEYVYYFGAANHTLANYGTFNPTYFINMDTAAVTFLTDLSLTGTYVNLPFLNLNGSAPRHLTLAGGLIQYTNIHGGNGASLNLSNGAYLTEVTADEIVLYGTVLVYGGVNFQNLINYASLHNRSDYDNNLYVYQRLENHGTIGSNPAGCYLYLYLWGDVYNYQILNPQYLSLGDGNSDLTRDISSTTPLSIVNITSYGDYRMLSDLSFTNSIVDWTSHDLLMQNGTASYSLTLSGGYLAGVYLYGGPSSALNLSNSAWLTGVTADDIIFTGEVLVGDNVSIDRLVNNGTLRNVNDASHAMQVNQTLENHGTIGNYSSTNQLFLTLFGNLYNYGTIANQELRLVGSATLSLWQSSSASPIACANLTTYSYGVPLQLLSSMAFSNCQIHLNDSPLLLYYGRGVCNLTLQGGWLQHAVLQTNGFSTLDLSSGAWLEYVDATAADIILRGTPFLGSDTTFDDLVNYGTLKNRDYFSWHLYCNGNLTNYGTIANFSTSNQLTLHCLKNLYNYGSILNQAVYIEGTANQYVLRGTGSSISCPGGFQLWSNIGYAQWYFNGVINDTNYLLFKSVNPASNGTWKPYNSGVWGRNIVIGTTAGTVTAPQNVSASLSGSLVKLQWNQVTNAIYYTVYYAEFPNGPYTAFSTKAFDNDLSDGVVWYELIPSEELRFYRVTAGR
jgi:hypothetical protein